MAIAGLLLAMFIYNLPRSFVGVIDKKISGSAHRCKQTVFSLYSY